ncbi:hypothetical protein CHUAL_011504 [Chamberlinius hualienensis]
MVKMVMKQCPQCEQQVPVACKSCPCGHMYFQARRPVNGQKSAEPSIGIRCYKLNDNTEQWVTSKMLSLGALGAVKKRRGEQLRQLRNANKDTNYGNLNRPKRTVPRSRSTNSTSTCNSTEDVDGIVEETLKKKRGRQKLNTTSEREAAREKDKDMYANIPPEQAATYSIILSEINRKMCLPNFTV